MDEINEYKPLWIDMKFAYFLVLASGKLMLVIVSPKNRQILNV